MLQRVVEYHALISAEGASVAGFIEEFHGQSVDLMLTCSAISLRRCIKPSPDSIIDKPVLEDSKEVEIKPVNLDVIAGPTSHLELSLDADSHEGRLTIIGGIVEIEPLSIPGENDFNSRYSECSTMPLSHSLLLTKTEQPSYTGSLKIFEKN
jgi:hypothetical protein